MHVLYSTPACYLKALHESSRRWPEYDDDFFPYADSEHAYWTGYYSSRPNFKFFARKANGFLQVRAQAAPVAFAASQTTSGVVGVLASFRRLLPRQKVPSHWALGACAASDILRKRATARAQYAFHNLVNEEGIAQMAIV